MASSHARNMPSFLFQRRSASGALLDESTRDAEYLGRGAAPGVAAPMESVHGQYALAVYGPRTICRDKRVPLLPAPPPATALPVGTPCASPSVMESAKAYRADLSTGIVRLLETAVVPLDAGRRFLLRFALGFSPLAYCLTRRERRLALQACCGVLVSTLLVVLVPAALLVLSPILFGVPHVASDIRHLLLRRQLAPGIVRMVGIFCVVQIIGRLLEEAGVCASLWPHLEYLLIAALLTVATARNGDSFRTRKALTVAVILVGCGLAAVHPWPARVLAAHGHNLITLLIWGLLFRRGQRAASLLPVAILGLGLVLLGSGAALPWTERAGGFVALGVNLHRQAHSLAPLPGLRAALIGAQVYALLSSVHYAVWLGWIPQEELRTEGSLSFRMSVRALVKDFGPRGLAAIVLLASIVILGSLVSLPRIHYLYVSISNCHAYLELAMLLHLWPSPLASRSTPTAVIAAAPREP